MLPLIVFIFLVALGSDYNIFLMSRVREEAAVHGTQRRDAARARRRPGPVITSAGLILAGTFCVLAVLPVYDLFEIGFDGRRRGADRHVRRALDARARGDVAPRRARVVAGATRCARAGIGDGGINRLVVLGPAELAQVVERRREVVGAARRAREVE